MNRAKGEYRLFAKAIRQQRVIERQISAASAGIFALDRNGGRTIPICKSSAPKADPSHQAKEEIDDPPDFNPMSTSLSNVDVCLSLVRYAQRSLEEHRKTAGSRARISFSMNNGAAHSGTEILELDGAWIVRSGSVDTLINPLSISSFKLID